MFRKSDENIINTTKQIKAQVRKEMMNGQGGGQRPVLSNMTGGRECSFSSVSTQFLYINQ